ncbi:hypothetical protein KQY27_01660 [Methanobrevibacter sp. TMH8]|uniref:hypothetical protein n=1 Tax=Methanobrevibacter sp. TMH8 TaxID=2848611 RepID=UPI001CCF0B84|nr:hypothetical protein [Methanobrevibacter sp. TMH8]MBZ9570253.1 hypothetical protein [Methanobrevibacter sp. TMH8]
MNKKILVYVAIICIVLAIVASIAFGVSNQKTQIDNKIISATIHGVAIENNSSNLMLGWMKVYHDEDNGVYYDFLMADSFNFTKKGVINLMSSEKLATKEYNDVQWEIYYSDPNSFNLKYELSKGISTDRSGYLCFASGKNGDYFVTVSSGAVHSNNSIDTDLFENYVEPLLNNITLKDPENPPKEYKILNSTKEEYDWINNYINQNGWEAIKDYMSY